jgi:hypothetical protein
VIWTASHISRDRLDKAILAHRIGRSTAASWPSIRSACYSANVMRCRRRPVDHLLLQPPEPFSAHFLAAGSSTLSWDDAGPLRDEPLSARRDDCRALSRMGDRSPGTRRSLAVRSDQEVASSGSLRQGCAWIIPPIIGRDHSRAVAVTLGRRAKRPLIIIVHYQYAPRAGWGGARERYFSPLLRADRGVSTFLRTNPDGADRTS